MASCDVAGPSPQDENEAGEFAEVVHRAFMLRQFTTILNRKVGIYQMLTGRVKGKQLEQKRVMFSG